MSRGALTTYRSQLREHALRQHGYVTPRDARELGIPPVELRKIAARGGLHKRGWGVYRFDDMPVSDSAPYMEAVLLVGDGAHIVGMSVLAFHDLAHVNPGVIHVSSPRRVRVTLPKTIELVACGANDHELTTYDGVPATTVARAIRDVRKIVMRSRLADAVDEAKARGLVRAAEARRLHADIAAR